MALNLKTLAQPKYLLIGGVAVVGGLYFASKLGSKKQSAEEPAVMVTPVQQPYAVANTEGYSPVQGGSYNGSVTSPSPPGTPQPPKPPSPTLPPIAPLPVPPSKPVPVPVPTPVPTPVKPPVDQSPGQLPPRTPTLPGTPRREPTPAPPTTPPITPNVPGGFSLDCRGVLPRPSDHPGANIEPLVRSKGNDARARAYALEWCVMGIANSGQTGLSRFTAWCNNRVYWPIINRNRRNRGLKALTETQMQQMVNQLHQLNATNGGRDDKLTVAQLQTLWATWHVPYLC